MLATLPWNLPPDLPWHLFTNPIDKWALQPSFVVGEYLFIGCALIALLHARARGRAHLLCWVAAIIAGTSNDMIFMALPLVDNFWQAQATIMLTPRLPLYIPCVYVCFMYFPTVAVWRLGLSALPRATLSGLSAIIFYAPYDIIGNKFLWWTWHDSDLPISNRIVGVPIGSSVWVITFVATFAFLIGWLVDRDPQVSGKSFAKGVALVAALCTLLMVVQMTLLQQIGSGILDVPSLLVVVAIYAAVAVAGLRKTRPKPPVADRMLMATLGSYFATMVLIGSSFDPATHVNESFHQTYGPCHVEAKDIVGLTRYKFLCAEDFDEAFSFDCVSELPKAGTDWYTVCGKPHQNFPLWMGSIAALCVLGALLYAWLLGMLGRARA